jgi:hypothetical protein
MNALLVGPSHLAQGRVSADKFRREYKSLCHRLTSWLLCFGMVWSGLAPTISHAMARANGQTVSWVEICTSMGIRIVKLDAQGGLSQPSAPMEKGAHFEHCPFCFTHSNVTALLNDGALWRIPAARHHEVPKRFLASPRSVFVWSSAQARGPPSIRS